MKDMKTWNSISVDALNFPLAADTRFCSPDYTNDHIWEIRTGSGDPPALSMETSFGLRARQMRLFPRFIHDDTRVTDPRLFNRQPRVTNVFPNYLSIDFSPFPNIDVIIEYWIPGSQVISSRMTINNASVMPEKIRVEWIVLMSPLDAGESMSTTRMNNLNVMEGRTANLSPVCCLDAITEPGIGPYSSLSVELDLFPGNKRQFTLALASLGSAQESFDLARRTLLRSWEAELTRIQLQNAAQTIEVYTGNSEWDAAFALSQLAAYRLFLPAGGQMPHPSYVLSRQPDHGFSRRGDGSDYPHLWSGQTPLDTCYLASLILPGGVDICEGLLRNFLAVEQENGFIDLKPGLSGQRSLRLAQPMLATLALQIDRYKDSSSWLVDLYPQLLRFVNAWFSEDHDQDQDGYPEWDHPLQTGLESCPMYDRWHMDAQGVSIDRIESPSLSAMLFRECSSLLIIARRVGCSEGVEWLKERVSEFGQISDKMWDSKSRTSHYRDSQTHYNGPAEKLLTIHGSGLYPLKKNYKIPRRLIVKLNINADTSRTGVRVTLRGSNGKNEICEEIGGSNLFWVENRAFATSNNVFNRLRQVEVNGLQAADEVIIHTVDYSLEDITLLLPLWAGMLKPRQARALIEETLMKRYLQPYGIPMTPVSKNGADDDLLHSVLLPWNQLIVEGMLKYGFRTAAADVVSRIMTGVVSALRQSGSFRGNFNASTARPAGDRNPLSGLAPLGLFLQTVGIKKISNHEIILDGINPFPTPVTVKYQGTTITCHTKDTVVTFPTGQTITVEGAGPHRVSLS
jgi:hypothetical protein